MRNIADTIAPDVESGPGHDAGAGRAIVAPHRFATLRRLVRRRWFLRLVMDSPHWYVLVERPLMVKGDLNVGYSRLMRTRLEMGRATIALAFSELDLARLKTRARFAWEMLALCDASDRALALARCLDLLRSSPLALGLSQNTFGKADIRPPRGLSPGGQTAVFIPLC